MRYLNDTDKLADAKANETITAVIAALTAAGFVATRSTVNPAMISAKTADGDDGKYIASVNVRRDRHDYYTIVRATVSANWPYGGRGTRLKDISFRARKEADFTIDPAKIVARVLAIATSGAERESTRPSSRSSARRRPNA